MYIQDTFKKYNPYIHAMQGVTVEMTHIVCIVCTMRQKRINLRLPENLHDLLTASATESGKNVTLEILDRLFSTYEKDDKLEAQIRAIVLEELDKRLPSK